MTNIALIAVLDTLLPGDDDGAAPLPAFSQAEIDPVALVVSAAPLLAAIDQPAFMRATVTDRIALLRKIEHSNPEVFRTFLGQALAAYYQAPRVQAALGWRSAPPQPEGHQLSAGDEAAWRMLEKVRNRGQLWRG
jgi:hypothetical protein